MEQLITSNHSTPDSASDERDLIICGFLRSAISFEHSLPHPFYPHRPADHRRLSAHRISRDELAPKWSMSFTEFNVLEYLSELCQRIEALSDQSVLHPSKCCCLARSYSLLVSRLHPVILLSTSSSSPLLPPELSALLAVIANVLLEGKRFIQDCILQEGELWLATKGLSIPFSTEIFDVHLHDLMWCISILVFKVSDYTLGDYWHQVNTVDALLWVTWALADEEGDVEKMQDLFHRYGARGSVNEQSICKLICSRLSENTRNSSTVRDNLTSEVVPDYLWMDPQGFIDKNEHLLGSNHSLVVFETSLMGARFAFKHFHREGYAEVFANEAVFHAGLLHANIVQLVCCSKRASTSGLVIELMDQDLCSFISSKERDYASFSLLARLDLILQIANGMQYLHELGIMHRDLKSPNILVSPSTVLGNTHMMAKIADFGTAKVKHLSDMFTTKPVGTSIWRAPEIIDGEDEEKYTRKADVYSFAIVCCEVLTGLPPDELFPPTRGTREFHELLRKGLRPELPSKCPTAIASYIANCWDGNASKRPSFKQICRVFRIFKACILLQENELLATPLQGDVLQFEDDTVQTNVAGSLEKGGRQRKGMHSHPVFNIPREMQMLRSSRAELFTANKHSNQKNSLLTKVESKINEGPCEDLGGSLAAVDERCNNFEFSTFNNSMKSSDSALNRTQDLLPEAIKGLEEEFEGLLAAYSKPQELANLLEYLPNFVQSTPSGGQGDGDEAAGKGISTRPAKGKTNKRRENFVSLIPPKTIPHLHKLAQQMITAGHHQQCCKIYRDTRASVLEQTLQELGVEKLSREDVHKMQWEVLEGKITTWIHIMPIAVKLLLSGERKVCDQIFHELEPYGETCFAEATSNSIIMLLSFGEGIASSKRSFEKLFVLLDMYKTMQELYPEVETIFGGKPSAHIRELISGLTQSLAQTAEETFGDFSEAVERDVTKVHVQDGTVHPLTSYVRFLFDYQGTLRQLFGEDETVEPANSQLAAATTKIMSALQSNLDGKSKLYQDPALAHVFLMNNIHYMVESVCRSEAKDVLGEDWVQRHRVIVEQHAIMYKRIAWAEVLQTLSTQELFYTDYGGLGNDSSMSYRVSRRTLIQDRFKTFNIEFDKLYRRQTQWFVPDVELRELLRLAVAEVLVPAYRCFLISVGSFLLENHKKPWKYIKFTPDELNLKLGELFEGKSNAEPHY